MRYTNKPNQFKRDSKRNPKRKLQFNKNGIRMISDRPARPRVINGEVFY